MLIFIHFKHKDKNKIYYVVIYMPGRESIIDTLGKTAQPYELMCKKYIDILMRYTNRNVLVYYSGFLQKPNYVGLSIDDNDKLLFMQAIHKMDRSLGLDIVLHTPGGSIAATESLVSYIKSLFGNNFRVIVPQIAMSAGTMIALASNEIIMGKQSNLGPIDPQYAGLSCAAIIEEFKRASLDVASNPSLAAVWAPIISKYHPTFLGECEKAISWSEDVVTEWLQGNMFSKREDAKTLANRVVKHLSSHVKTLSHERHIHIDDIKKLGVNVSQLEGYDNKQIDDCIDMQDCIVTLHYIIMETLTNRTQASKIVMSNTSRMTMLTTVATGGR